MKTHTVNVEETTPASAIGLICQSIWETRATAGRRHTLIERLTKLRDTKDGFLTVCEYAEIRSEFLGELATRPRMPFSQVLITITLCATGFAGIIYCFLHHMPGIALVPAMPLAASGLIWWHRERDYAAKWNFSHFNRLEAVNELAEAALISAEEASTIRGRIAEMYEDERVACHQ